LERQLSVAIDKVRARSAAAGPCGMDTPVVAYLGDEYLVPITVQTCIDWAGSEVVGIRHAARLDPTDRAWVTDQNFVLVEGMTLMLSPNFCASAQVLSRLPDVKSVLHVGSRDVQRVITLPSSLDRPTRNLMTAHQYPRGRRAGAVSMDLISTMPSILQPPVSTPGRIGLWRICVLRGHLWVFVANFMTLLRRFMMLI